MNIPKLRGKIVEKGMSVDRLAAAIGIHKSTLYCKLGEERKFTVAEAKAMEKRSIIVSDGYEPMMLYRQDIGATLHQNSQAQKQISKNTTLHRTESILFLLTTEVPMA